MERFSPDPPAAAIVWALMEQYIDDEREMRDFYGKLHFAQPEVYSQELVMTAYAEDVSRRLIGAARAIIVLNWPQELWPDDIDKP